MAMFGGQGWGWGPNGSDYSKPQAPTASRLGQLMYRQGKQQPFSTPPIAFPPIEFVSGPRPIKGGGDSVGQGGGSAVRYGYGGMPTPPGALSFNDLLNSQPGLRDSPLMGARKHDMYMRYLMGYSQQHPPIAASEQSGGSSLPMLINALGVR